jgi:hypothetical protein
LKEVVLAPDLIGAAFIDPHARAVLESWRDGTFKVILNRQLLLLHLRTLRDIGLTDELIKRWTLWLTSPEKAIFLSDVTFVESSSPALCDAIASGAEFRRIICRSKPPGASPQWITASEFL